MQAPDIHTAIAELAGLYDELNRRWAADPCSTNVYQVYRQEEYRDVHNKLKAVNIEGIALKIIADSINEKVLSRLRELLADNIRLYETRREEFNGIGFDSLYQLWEEYLFGSKHTLLLNDRDMIKDYPYPTEREREILLKENQSDLNQLDNERYDLRRADAQWIGKDYYGDIYNLSRSFASIIDSYFPLEKEIKLVVANETAQPEESPMQVKEVAPDEIFRTRMFDKFRELEARLIKDGDLDDNLNWLAKHKNDRPDIKRLVTFLTGLLDNNYFLPGRDSAIKAFFESRYHISIRQNFERKRREPLLKEYRAVFYDYPF